MRRKLTRDRIRELMKAMAHSAPRGRSFRVFFVGGGTAVHAGWRESTIDANLYSDQEEVFQDIQRIKESLNMNVEFARPENFVPPLEGSEERHVFIETVGRISFYHYDPYAQLLSKVVRGFERDMQDAESFLKSGMVAEKQFRSLVLGIPDEAYAKYPAISKKAVLVAVEDFLSRFEG